MAFIVPILAAVGTGTGAAAAGATVGAAAWAGAGVIATGASLIGTGISAVSALRAGKNARTQANFEADQQEQGAVVAGYNAQNALANGEREVAQVQDARIRALASQEAAVAGSGLTISGSAIDVMRDSVVESEQDITNARWRAKTDAYNYGAEAKSLLTSSAYTRTAGANAYTSSKWSAAATAFDGLSRAGSSYFNVYRSGR